MAPLTAAELTSMRAAASGALPGTAVIQSQTLTSDGGGGGTTSWSAAGTVDCRLAPIGGMGAGEGESGGRISADAQFIVTLPFDAVVTTNSRLLIDTEVFNVEAIRDRSWNLSTRVECIKEV